MASVPRTPSPVVPFYPFLPLFWLGDFRLPKQTETSWYQLILTALLEDLATMKQASAAQ